MKKTPFNIDSLPAPRASFSRGLELEIAGHKLIFISGTASVGPKTQTMHRGDLEKQVRHTYRNIERLLASRGAKFRHVVRWTCYLRDMANYEEFCRLREDVFRRHGLQRKDYPASTCVEARLCREDLMVEIEAMAVVPPDDEE
jgi:2-iminobutanoate/2-iminopropanoate deaminase